MTITRYRLKDEFTQPPFEFVLLTGDIPCVDYYLFKEDEFEQAMAQLKAEFAKGFDMARILLPQFCNHDRTWRLKEFMSLDIDGNVRYERYGETHLHVKFYLDAGEWQNPREGFDLSEA